MQARWRLSKKRRLAANLGAAGVAALVIACALDDRRFAEPDVLPDGAANPNSSADVGAGSGDAAALSCPEGRKICADTCVALDDPNYGCGPTTCSTETCPPPGDGTLICQDSTCAVGACGAGTKKCGGACVNLDDVQYGCSATSCDATACPEVAGATFACSVGVCVVDTCPEGTKKCGDNCVALDDVNYGCGATTCDKSTCPAPGTATLACQAGACVIGTCGARTKKCGDRCVAIDDVSFGCGATTCDASSCPEPGTGTLVCSGDQCVIGDCGAGTKKCGNRCVPTDVNNGCADPAVCTACASSESCEGTPSACTCVPNDAEACSSKECGPATNNCGTTVTCPNTCSGVTTCGGGGAGVNGCGCTANNTAACVGKACGPAINNCGTTITCPNTCSAGNKCEGNGCIKDCGSNTLCPDNNCYNLSTDPTHCRSCSTNCGTPPNGTAICTASGCDVNCGANLYCSRTCCPPPPPNQIATCSGSQCGNACRAGTTTLSCANPVSGRPACGSWTFESRTDEGWTLDTTVVNNAATGAQLRAPPAGLNAGAFSVAVNIAGVGGGNMILGGNVCPGGNTLNPGFLTFKVDVYVQGPTAGLGGPGYVELYNGPTFVAWTGDLNLFAGQWQTWSVSTGGNAITRAELHASFTSWTGVLYFDNLRLE